MGWQDAPVVTPASSGGGGSWKDAPIVSNTTAAASGSQPSLIDSLSTGFQNTAAGVGKAFTDLGLGAKQRLDEGAAYLEGKFGQLGGTSAAQILKDTQAQVDAKRYMDQALMQTTGGKVGNFIGTAIPAAVSMLIPGAQTLAGSALTGAALGAIEPTTANESALKNAAIGATGGAAGYGATKLIAPVVNGVKSLAQPFYGGGKDAIVGGRILAAAGSDADQAAAMRALSGANELVPGSLPTAGQSSGNAGIAALERTAAQTDPAMTNAFAARVAEQNAARVDAMKELAGTNGARDFFAADRDAVANKLYGEARAAGIDPTMLTPDALNNIASMQARVPQEVLDRAQLLARLNNTPLTDATSLEGMHWVKKGLDSLVKKAKSSGDTDLAAAYAGLQKDFVEGLGELSPAYDQARQTFLSMSKPVNQMDVAQAILDKASNKLTGNLQPNAFATALSDKTAASATGFRGATLENTMDPAQLATLAAVKDDLARSVFAQNAGRAGSDSVQKLAYSNIMNGMNVPGFVRNFTGSQVVANLAARAADAVYGRANKDLSTRLAESLLDPSKTVGVMQDALRSIEGNQAVANIAGVAAPISGVTGAVTGIINSQRSH